MERKMTEWAFKDTMDLKCEWIDEHLTQTHKLLVVFMNRWYLLITDEMRLKAPELSFFRLLFSRWRMNFDAQSTTLMASLSSVNPLLKVKWSITLRMTPGFSLVFWIRKAGQSSVNWKRLQGRRFPNRCLFKGLFAPLLRRRYNWGVSRSVLVTQVGGWWLWYRLPFITLAIK